MKRTRTRMMLVLSIFGMLALAFDIHGVDLGPATIVVSDDRSPDATTIQEIGMSSLNSSQIDEVEPMNRNDDAFTSGDEWVGENFLTLYMSSGEIVRQPLPIRCTVSSFTLNGSTTVFLNDERSGDKVDILLSNYTLISQGYLLRGKVRVIVLLGTRLSGDMYQLSSVGASEISSFSQKLRQFDGEILSTYKSFPFVAAELPYGRVYELAESDFVAHVFLDKKCKVQLADSVPMIKPPEMWEQIELNYGFEINGSGVKIAILDTGIDKNHPDLDDLDDNPITNDVKVVDEKCFTDENCTWDGRGHGTHCASIAAGTGKVSNYTYVGVAPAAMLLNGKVLTDGGWGYDSWIISGIEWAVNKSANIISMSLGADVNGDGSDPLSMAVDWATEQGVVCAVAAGNAGSGGMFRVGKPAVSKKAITVGATTKADEMASLSSQGPSADYRLKPDVCAPGIGIVAARGNGTSMGNPIDEHYTVASGTSMSTPHVAGAAALILQSHPHWIPVMIKSTLMGNAKVLDGEHLWEQGAGRIDVGRSTNTTLLIIKPNSSFGILGLGEIANETLIIMNVGETSISINVSALAFCESQEANYVSINATSLSIPAYDNATVMLQAGPLDEQAPEGWYEGWVNVTNVHGDVKAPFLFGAFSEIALHIYDVDNATSIWAMIVLTTYPNMSFVDFATAGPHEDTHFLVKSGNYTICAQAGWISRAPYDPTRMFMLQELISAPRFSLTDVSISLADAKVSQIPTIDSSGNNLTIHTFVQHFCGGPQNWVSPYFQSSEWSSGCIWSGYDLNLSHLTFYSTNYTPPDRLCEALGYHASNALLSEVYLMPLKYWNLSSLPCNLSYPRSDLAKYRVFYDIPETYPENGVKAKNAFWFTWDHLGGLQVWHGTFERIYAGLNATYFLAPGNGIYHGDYMLMYDGWPINTRVPLEEWNIGRHYPYPQIPPEKGETGSLVLGAFSFAPYQPGLEMNVSRSGETFLVNLTGDIWKNLSWPHLQWYMFAPFQGPESPYPQHYAEYRVYVDQTLFGQGKMNGKKGFGGKPYIHYPPNFLDVDWCGISETWNVSGSEVLLQLVLPSMVTISEYTIYNMSFSLGDGDSTPPIITGLSYPLNYTPSQDLHINFTTWDIGLGVGSHFLKYSFDNGTTWQDATYQEPHYIVHCEEADCLAILINVTDNAGNSLQYFSTPISFCGKVRLNAPEEIVTRPGAHVNVTGNLTSIEGKCLSGIVVSLSSGEPTYTIPDESGTFTFNFYAPNIPGSYIRIVALISVGFYNSEEVYIELLVARAHDVTVTNVTVSKTVIGQGNSMSINVTVADQGDFTEAFNVTLYYGTALIGKQTVGNLSIGSSVVITFTWNTTGSAKGNYTISAEADVIPSELDTANNNFTDGWVIVAMPGDISGPDGWPDGKCDIKDVAMVAKLFGVIYPDTRYDPNCDLTGPTLGVPDGKIDIKDVALVAKHYGEIDP